MIEDVSNHMKRSAHIVRFAVAFLLGSLVTIAGYFINLDLRRSLERGIEVGAQSDGRQVFMVMQQFAFDELTTKGALRFPTSLNQIVEHDYLSSIDAHALERLNTYVFPLGATEIPKDARMVALIASFRNYMFLYYTDQSVETIKTMR